MKIQKLFESSKLYTNSVKKEFIISDYIKVFENKHISEDSVNDSLRLDVFEQQNLEEIPTFNRFIVINSVIFICIFILPKLFTSSNIINTSLNQTKFWRL